MSNSGHICPVCGYENLREAPRDSQGKSPSNEIRPSCGTQFGYQDSNNSLEVLREAWLQMGATWHSRVRQPPENWSAFAQLERAGLACSSKGEDTTQAIELPAKPI